MNILKFGGTSMTNQESWLQVLDIIRSATNPIVVVSATAKTTRQLLFAGKEAAKGSIDSAIDTAKSIENRHLSIIKSFFSENQGDHKIELEADCLNRVTEISYRLSRYLHHIYESKNLSRQSQDSLLSLGEQISSYLLSSCGQYLDIPLRHIDATEIIQTDSNFGSANPNTELINQKVNQLLEILDQGKIPVMGGFFGQNELGEITTLGFEGSDYTATLIAGALDADSVVIWTDVNGIYTCDPRTIPGAKTLEALSFQEATELAYFGAKVLHPSTLKPVQKENIPVFVKNLFDPVHPGTCITNKLVKNGPVCAITYRENVVIYTLSAFENSNGYEFLSNIFSILRNYRIPVDVVNTTENSVIIALENHPNAKELLQEFKRYGLSSMEKDKTLISLIGCHFNDPDEFLTYLFKELPDSVVDMISYSRIKQHLSIVVDGKNNLDAVRAIHNVLFP